MRRLKMQPRAMMDAIDVVLLLLALGVGVASAIALAGRAYWIAELFTHFRVQYIVLQLPILIALLVRKRVLVASLTALLLAANLGGVAGYWPSRATAAASSGDFRLMTANLNRSNDDVARFIDLVHEARPDAILLLEVTAAWSEALGTLVHDYPAQYLMPRDDAFGIGLLARTPFAAVGPIELRGAPAIDARLALRDGRRMRLVGAHLWPPVSAARARERNAQLAALGSLIAGVPEPIVVSGDFNITPYSPVMADWLVATGLVDPRRGHGFAITWPTGFPVLGVPIDHSLVNEHVMASEPRRSAAFGSDHFAIITSLSLRE